MGFFAQTVAVDRAFADDFSGWGGKRYGSQEKPGMVSWAGGALDYIRVNDGRAVVAAGLDKRVYDLIHNGWKEATRPGANIKRHANIALGSHRPMTPENRRQAYIPVGAFDYKAKLGAPVVSSAKHLQDAVPKDWSIMKDIPMVTAYAFRGDSRSPEAIRNAGGFQPPISRTDQHYVRNVMYPIFRTYLKAKVDADISLEAFERIVKNTVPDPKDRLAICYYGGWRARVEHESMHLGRMLASEDMKGYISTTKAVTVAKGFAKMSTGTGWVYAVRVKSGFLVPAKKEIAWTELFGEEEIASPFPIGWEDVYGWRQVNNAGLFTGPVVLRTDFKMQDPSASKEVYELLSGRPQN